MTFLVLSFLVACGGAPEPSMTAATPAATTSTAPTPAAAPAPAVLDAACLEQADARDGATDKVVHKCAGCGLGMEGDPAFASTHGGMTFHSCSDGCKMRLDADPAGVLASACPKP